MDVKTLSGILGHTRATFTLDTYTHTTGDMQKRAAEIVDEFLTDIFGEELKPWQENEKTEKELSAWERTADGKDAWSSATMTRVCRKRKMCWLKQNLSVWRS